MGNDLAISDDGRWLITPYQANTAFRDVWWRNDAGTRYLRMGCFDTREGSAEEVLAVAVANGESMHALLDRARQREHGERIPCDFDVDPFETDPEEQANPWHHLRVCLFCGGHWWGLHCPHDGHQNPCPWCDRRPVTLHTECVYAEDLV